MSTARSARQTKRARGGDSEREGGKQTLTLSPDQRKKMKAAIALLLDKFTAGEENDTPDMFTEDVYDSTLIYTGYDSPYDLRMAARAGVQEILDLIDLDINAEAFNFVRAGCSLIKPLESGRAYYITTGEAPTGL